MKGKKLITITLVLVMLLSCLLPAFEVYADTSKTITLNSKLYSAVKSSLENQGIQASYNDQQYTLTISEEDINNVTTLKLSNSGIKDLTGLENFTALTNLDLSANELTKDSNLGVLSNMALTYLDLSSNEISDLSIISNLSNIATLNLHNQKFSETTIISNEIVDDGTINNETTLPQILNYAGALKSEWLDSEIITDDGLSVKWSTLTQGKISLVIGSEDGSKYTGLVSIKIKVTDSNNTLYNSEIVLNYVVINEDETGIIIKDENLYKAIKNDNLVKDQSVNTDLSEITDDRNLYVHAYDEQLVFVIKTSDVINKIKSLVLDNDKIEDLTGIEKFVGLKTGLDVSSNYIDSIDKIIELQQNKDSEEAKLQERFNTKVSQLKTRIEKLTALQNELESVVKAYNDAVTTFNGYVNSTDLQDTEKLVKEKELLDTLKENGKRYIELTGKPVTLFGVTYNTTDELDGLNGVSNTLINELVLNDYSESGEIGAAIEKVDSKMGDLYNIYNDMYKTTTIITSDLKKLTPDEVNKLNIEEAKALLNAQVLKLSSVEKMLTDEDKDVIQNGITNISTQGQVTLLVPGLGVVLSDEEDETPLADALKDLVETYEEDEVSVTRYRNYLNRLKSLDARITTNNYCLLFNAFDENAGTCVNNNYSDNYQNVDSVEDGEGILYEYSMHGNCQYETTVAIQDLIKLAQRISNSTELNSYIVLPRLKQLNMSENLIENIDNIEILKELVTLDMGENEIVNIDNIAWDSFDKLKTLYLDFNNISDIKSLENLKDITDLDLSSNLIAGKIEFDIVNMENLEKLDLSSNQIDNIENLISQFEFKAKDKNMTANEYIVSSISGAPQLNLGYQKLELNATVSQNDSNVKIELPMIFRQAEKLQWEETKFGVESYYGNVTSDGKSVILNARKVGNQSAHVNIIGDMSGICYGTTCIIDFTVTESNTTNNTTNDTVNNTVNNTTNDTVNNTVNNTTTNTTTDDGKVILTINTVESSSIESVKTIGNVSYAIVKPNTTVEEVLNELSLNTDKYSIEIKDSSNTSVLNNEETLKTDNILAVNGLEDEINCKIVVKGDVTGDGIVNIEDVLKVNQYRNQKTELSESEFLAGKVTDANDEIGIEDVLKLNQYRLNKIDVL